MNINDIQLWFWCESCREWHWRIYDCDCDRELVGGSRK